MLIFLIILFVVAITALAIAGAQLRNPKPKSADKASEEPYEVLKENTSSPQIAAAVSIEFQDEIKTYCSKHEITISDLIRKSVREYMDMHN